MLSLTSLKHTQINNSFSELRIKEKTYTVVYQELKDYGGTFVWEEFTVQCKSYTYTQVNCVVTLLDNTNLYIPKNQVVSIKENK
jgi:hypothetical protein